MAPLVFTVMLVAIGAAVAMDHYTDRFDNVDVDGVLMNERLFNNYLKCFLAATDGGCTADAKSVKGVLGEALQTDCAKCTEKQKQIMGKVIPFLRENKMDAWTKLSAKYDPEGVYTAKYAATGDS